jgi:hypothetical protein
MGKRTYSSPGHYHGPNKRIWPFAVDWMCTERTSSPGPSVHVIAVSASPRYLLGMPLSQLPPMSASLNSAQSVHRSARCLPRLIRLLHASRAIRTASQERPYALPLLALYHREGGNWEGSMWLCMTSRTMRRTRRAGTASSSTVWAMVVPDAALPLLVVRKLFEVVAAAIEEPVRRCAKRLLSLDLRQVYAFL